MEEREMEALEFVLATLGGGAAAVLVLAASTEAAGWAGVHFS